MPERLRWRKPAQGTTRLVVRMLTLEVDQSRRAGPSEEGSASEDQGILRIIYFGEALRAVQTYVSETLLSGPSEPMIDVLDAAFDRLSDIRSGFTPEEFTTYYMSILLELCEDADEARRLRRGAMRYMLASASALPPEFSSVLEDARRLLAAEGMGKSDHVDPHRSSSQRLAVLLVQAQNRHNPRKILETSMAGVPSLPLPDAEDPAGYGNFAEGRAQRSGRGAYSRCQGPARRRNSATPSRSGGTIATLGLVAFLLYLASVAIGLIEPSIEPHVSSW